MKLWKSILGLALLLLAFGACKEHHANEPAAVETHVITEKVAEKSMAALKAELLEDGFEIFDYVDEESGDTVIMQQYFIAFLKIIVFNSLHFTFLRGE